ncbi:MAG TPA: shikimate kinase [Candidatus Bathyarchaeia archaeon]|nr:shikimate kinase [Candidatus Bathyarchaeia archaeon]
MTRATARGAGTVINAIATLNGSAFAIDLKTQADVEIINSGITCEIADDPSADTSLLAECGRLFVERYAPGSGIHITTRSEIPIASGLKSSSAAANATVLALTEALDVAMAPLDIVRLGVTAARRAGVTVTGAFDDACASFFGGLVFTDNEHDVLVKRVELNADVVVYVPRDKAYSAQADVTRAKLLAPWVETAYNLALDGYYKKAMVLNGLLYCAAFGFSSEPILSALAAGAHAATLSGTGPAYIALVDRSSLRSVKQAWEPLEGLIIVTKASNLGAQIETL